MINKSIIKYNNKDKKMILFILDKQIMCKL